MKAIISPASKSFSEIRKSLNPCCCYVILENRAGSDSEDEIRAAFDALPFESGDIIEKRFYRDIQTSRLLLVLKLAPKRGDSVKNRMLTNAPPPPMTLYYYGRHGNKEPSPFGLQL